MESKFEGSVTVVALVPPETRGCRRPYGPGQVVDRSRLDDRRRRVEEEVVRWVPITRSMARYIEEGRK